jgi:MFS superfamily sulfate permease-like transporter
MQAWPDCPQAGIYGYLLGGLGYALLGSSRQLAIGPTSAISLMIASTVGDIAAGDVEHRRDVLCRWRLPHYGLGMT